MDAGPLKPRGGQRTGWTQGNWHLLSDPAARYRDLGPDHHASRTSRDKKIRGHIRQLQALGLDVTITGEAA